MPPQPLLRSWIWLQDIVGRGTSYAGCIKDVSVASDSGNRWPLWELSFFIPWQSPNWMAHSATTTPPILNLIEGGCRARRQLCNSIRYVSLASRLMKLLPSVRGVSSMRLEILCSVADISTTGPRTLILFAGGCWAWCQLSNGIRYVSVISKPMNSLSSVERVSGLKLAIFYFTADYSTTATLSFMLFAGRCLSCRQLSNGIRYVSVASKLMSSLSTIKGVLVIKLAIFYSTADYSTTSCLILILIAGGCWPWHRLHNDIRYFPRTLFMKQHYWIVCWWSQISMADSSTTSVQFWIWLWEVVGPDASYAVV